MSIFGCPISRSNIESKINAISTQINSAMSNAIEVYNIFVEYTDDELDALFVASGSSGPEADALTAQFREWLYHVKKVTENYQGEGDLADRSFHISRRASL